MYSNGQQRGATGSNGELWRIATNSNVSWQLINTLLNMGIATVDTVYVFSILKIRSIKLSSKGLSKLRNQMQVQISKENESDKYVGFSSSVQPIGLDAFLASLQDSRRILTMFKSLSCQCLSYVQQDVSNRRLQIQERPKFCESKLKCQFCKKLLL